MKQCEAGMPHHENAAEDDEEDEEEVKHRDQIREKAVEHDGSLGVQESGSPGVESGRPAAARTLRRAPTQHP